MKAKKNRPRIRNIARGQHGFTIPEVIVAGMIMVILCVGTLTVFSYAVRINRGNNLRMQALSVLQQEVEYYRSLKYVPVGTDAGLNQGTYTNVRQHTTPDGRVFNVSVVITNLPGGTSDVNSTFKEIAISATPAVAENEGWLQNLGTNVTIQRVRAN